MYKTILHESYIRHRMIDKRIGSIRALALRSGLSQNTLHSALRRGSFSISTADAIANTLGCLSHDVMTVVDADSGANGEK